LIDLAKIESVMSDSIINNFDCFVANNNMMWNEIREILNWKAKL
jgi:hypothetical protein